MNLPASVPIIDPMVFKLEVLRQEIQTNGAYNLHSVLEAKVTKRYPISKVMGVVSLTEDSPSAYLPAGTTIFFLATEKVELTLGSGQHTHSHNHHTPEAPPDPIVTSIFMYSGPKTTAHLVHPDAPDRPAHPDEERPSITPIVIEYLTLEEKGQ